MTLRAREIEGKSIRKWPLRLRSSCENWLSWPCRRKGLRVARCHLWSKTRIKALVVSWLAKRRRQGRNAMMMMMQLWIKMRITSMIWRNEWIHCRSTATKTAAWAITTMKTMSSLRFTMKKRRKKRKRVRVILSSLPPRKKHWNQVTRANSKKPRLQAVDHRRSWSISRRKSKVSLTMSMASLKNWMRLSDA